MRSRVAGIIFIVIAAVGLAGCWCSEEECKDNWQEYNLDKQWCMDKHGLVEPPPGPPEPPPGPPIIIGPGDGGGNMRWQIQDVATSTWNDQAAGGSILNPASADYRLLRKDFIGISAEYLECERTAGNYQAVEWVKMNNGLGGANKIEITLKTWPGLGDRVDWYAKKGNSEVTVFPKNATNTGKVPLEFTQMKASTLEDHTGASCITVRFRVNMPV